jgi:ankyrin repeat protein
LHHFNRLSPQFVGAISHTALLIHSIPKRLSILWFVSVTLCLRNETALHLASKHGNIEAAEILLNAGASTCARDIAHLRTALHFAISHNHQSLALLLASRAPFSDSDLLDDNHETPLHLAVKNSLPAVVSALLQAKANIESENIDHLTPLLLACSHDHHKECLDALLAAGANVDSLNVFQWGPLHRACKHGCRSAVVRLLSSGAHADVTDMELRTPLYLAACGGHENCVDELLQASASVCACDRSRRTSLHMAAIKNYPEIARRLLAMGADANAKDINLMTPLHFAAQHGHDAVIELLVNSHADIDALDTHKYSALDWAAANDHISAATQLLQARGIGDANRKNGIEIAKSRGHYKIADAINRMGSEPKEAA